MSRDSQVLVKVGRVGLCRPATRAARLFSGEWVPPGGVPGGWVPGLLRCRTALLAGMHVARRSVRLSPPLSAHHGDASCRTVWRRALSPLPRLRSSIWPAPSIVSRNVRIREARMVVCRSVILVYRGNIAREKAIDVTSIGLGGAGRRDVIGPAVPITVFGRHVCGIVGSWGR